MLFTHQEDSMSDLLSDLRKEQLRSPDPSAHVFRISSEQEQQLIDAGSIFYDLLSPHYRPTMLVSLFGCRVKVRD